MNQQQPKDSQRAKFPMKKGTEFRKLSYEEHEFLMKSRYYPYIVTTDENIYYVFRSRDKTADWCMRVLSTRVSIKERLYDLDTKRVKVNILVENDYLTKEQEYTSEVLTTKGMLQLYEYGVRFSEKDASLLADFLMKTEKEAPLIYCYETLGWFETEEGYCFKGDKLYKNGDATEGRFMGKIDITPHGSLDEWLTMVREEVIGNIPLTLAMTLGFTSPVLQFLNFNHDLGSIMFNLSQTSSKGKTTATMLAVSAFSNPLVNRGTMITYNGTDNAISEFISSCNGFTVGLDEAAMERSSNFTRFLYSISSGVSKKRLNSDGEQRDVKYYNSVIISTAEFDLINANTPDGIRVRVFELNDPLTASAEQSERIKTTVINNYGVAGRAFIEYLSKRTGSIEACYKKNFELLKSKCEDTSSLTDRVLSKLAVVYTTYKYMIKALKIKDEVDVKAFRNYLLSIEERISSEGNPEDRLLEAVKSFAEENYKNFIIVGKDRDRERNCSIYGSIDNNGIGCLEISITEPILNRIAREEGFSGLKHILQNLKKRQFLSTEKDRLYKRAVLLSDMGRTKLYCFVYNTLHEVEDGIWSF